MNEHIITPYAPILVESIRSIGYSFESALSDIIDNSISKQAQNISIYFDSNSPQYVAIVDDGCGMSKEELLNAMRYGSKKSTEERDKEDLGRFGLGLKTASLSQCRILTVITKKNNKRFAAQWDIDYVIATNDWTLKFFDETQVNTLQFFHYLDKQESGTIVVWENFDRIVDSSIELNKVFDEKIEIARQHISLVFHRFINKKKINIRFNDMLVDSIDPFLTEHPATQILDTHRIAIDNEDIYIKPYILPHLNKLKEKDKKKLGDISELRRNQGFYVYRNNRLIIWGTWFRLVKQLELNKLARISIDIPNSLDHIWDIDIKKSSASLPNIIRKSLVSIVEKTIGRSERVYRYRGRNIQNNNIQHIWNLIENRGTYQYQINRNSVFYKRLEEMINEKDLRYLDLFIKSIEDMFPYADVYLRQAQSESKIAENSMSEDEIYTIGRELLHSMSNELERKIFLESLDNIDLFKKYPTVINTLLREANYEC
ncbi:hypothetical protein A4G19_07090 [Pasteurellaceae bacterium Macca]|nr:hypothetical protein [Pasteurellaceae bacterium Macca]